MAEKKMNKKQITVNMDDELFDAIKEIAEDKEHSLSHTARNFIKNAVRTQRSFRDEIVEK